MLADGSALLFVRYRHRDLRPILKPEGQDFVLAHCGCFYSRVLKVRVKLDKDVPALPQHAHPSADLFLFTLSGMDFGFQPGDLRLQLLALVMQGVIPLSILRLILHLMLVFLNAALQQLHFGIMVGLELFQVLLQLSGIGDDGQQFLKPGDVLLLVPKQLVEGCDKAFLYLVLPQTGGGADGIAFVLLIAPPDMVPVLGVGLQHLPAIAAAAVPADEFSGKQAAPVHLAA